MIKILYLVSFFPHVGISGASFDTQPWAIFLLLIISFLIFLDKFKNLDRDSLVLLFLSAFIVSFAAIITLIQEPRGFVEFNTLIYLRNILSWATIPLFIFIFTNTKKESISRVFFFSIVVYFFVALIQLLFDQNFLSIITPREVNVSNGRGVPSLSSEQFKFGKVILIQMIISQIIFLSGEIKLYQRNFIVLISAFEMFIFCQAATAIAMFLTILFLYFLFRSQSYFGLFIRFIVTSVSLIMLINLAASFFPQYRFGLIADVLINNFSTLAIYGGVTERIFNLPFSIFIGLYEYFPFGFGLGSNVILSQIFEFDIFLTIKKGTTSMAHGGFVGHIYSTGLLGVLWIALIFGSTFKNIFGEHFKDRKEWIFLLLSIVIVSFFEGSLANPIMGLTLSIFLVYSRSKRA